MLSECPIGIEFILCCSLSSRCGEGVQSLFVEFSEGNIKLTRCVSCQPLHLEIVSSSFFLQSSCGQVADKYIEYELILVLIDVVLHRKAAFRHIYNNRSDFWKSNVRCTELTALLYV